MADSDSIFPSGTEPRGFGQVESHAGWCIERVELKTKCESTSDPVIEIRQQTIIITAKQHTLADQTCEFQEAYQFHFGFAQTSIAQGA